MFHIWSSKKVYDVIKELYLGDIVFEYWMESKNNQIYSAQELDTTVIGYLNDSDVVDIRFE